LLWEAARVGADTPFAYNETVSDEKQKEGQDLRSKLTALGFRPEQNETQEDRCTGIVGGVRKPIRVTEGKQETAREKLARLGFGPERDMTEECLARGEYGFLGIGERLSIRLFEDDGIIPAGLREFTESENEGSFFLKTQPTRRIGFQVA
jgi:hypothetical protein